VLFDEHFRFVLLDKLSANSSFKAVVVVVPMHRIGVTYSVRVCYSVSRFLGSLGVGCNHYHYDLDFIEINSFLFSLRVVCCLRS